MIGFHLICAIVETEDIDDRRHALAETAVQRRRDRPGRIKAVDQPLLHAGDPRATRIALDRLFFVADGPGDDRGPVAIAPDQRLQLDHGRIVGRHPPGLVDDHHAQRVAGIQKLGRGGIMRGAIGVAAHALELFDAPVLKTVGKRRTDTGMVLMATGAFQLDGLGVQQEATGGVEHGGADTEGLLDAIDQPVTDTDLGDQAIEVRCLDRPECRLIPGQRRHSLAVGPGIQSRLGSSPGDGNSVHADDTRIDHAGRGRIRLILQSDRHAGGGARSDRLRSDQHAPLRHVDWIGGHQPDVPIQACTLIEPAFAQRGVDPHRQDGGLTGRHDVGDVHPKRRIAASVLVDDEPVYENQTVAKGAVKLQ